MKTNRKLLIACILGLLLALAALILRKRHRAAQSNNQPPTDV
jgi:hypothetical protein